jgi:hypothetical protein
MMKPLFIVPGPIYWATSRFRAYWLAPFFEDSDVIEFECLRRWPDGIKPYMYYSGWTHLIWLKQCDPALVRYYQQKHDIPSLWDVTDPMWWFSPETSWEIAEAVQGVTTSSKGLAEDYFSWRGRRAHYLPDTVSLEHYGEPKNDHEGKAKKLIWYGHHANRMTLFGAMTNLMRLEAYGHDFTLTIMDDIGDDGKIFNAPWITRIKFNLDLEPEILKAHDLAILPPYPGPWGKCKSHNKQFTAGAAGLPYVSGLHWNQLLDFYNQPDRRRNQAYGERKMVEQRYRSAHGAHRLRKYLEKIR